MISRTAGEVERSKAALICWGILQVWLKSMQLFFHNSLLCKPLDILNGSRAATRFSCFLLSLFFFQNSSKCTFSLGGAEEALTCSFLFLFFWTEESVGGNHWCLVPLPSWEQRARHKVFKVRKVSGVKCHLRVNEQRKPPPCVKKFLFVLWICNVST